MSIAKDRGDLTITLHMKGRPVVLVGDGTVADEHRTLLTRAGAFIVAEGSKANFAVVVDDRAAVSRLKVRGALVYAVGEPELSDFTLGGSPVPVPSPRARKAKAAAASEPAPAISAPQPSAIKEKRERPAKPPKEPITRTPREPFKMPSVSFDPALRALDITKSWSGALWSRVRAALPGMLKWATPVTDTVATAFRARIERARARPISLDMALVKGGPLDEQAPGEEVALKQPQAE